MVALSASLPDGWLLIEDLYMLFYKISIRASGAVQLASTNLQELDQRRAHSCLVNSDIFLKGCESRLGLDKPGNSVCTDVHLV